MLALFSTATVSVWAQIQFSSGSHAPVHAEMCTTSAVEGTGYTEA